MGKNTIKESLFILFVTSIPAILTYMGSSERFVKWLSSRELIKVGNENNWMMFFSILSVTVPFMIIAILYEQKKQRNEDLKKQRDFLLVEHKENFLSAVTVKHELDENFKNLNMRIWIEEKNYFTKYFVYDKTPKSKLFRVKYIENLSEEGIKKNLHFEVNPTRQGLVGICYNKKETIHLIDVSTLYEQHNLSPYQIKLTSDTKFVLCIPILNEKSKVIAIVSFDHKNKIVIPDEHREKVYELLQYFCLTQFENIPELLKKRG